MDKNKKNTRVSLPGGIAGLVHTAQQRSENAQKNEAEAAKETAAPVQNGDKKVTSQDASAPASQTAKQGQERSYKVARDNGADSWQLFIDLAKDYKQRSGKLATIYIDEDLKNVLDRLKSAADIKLPTTAILSSIVARFIYDHEDKIKELVYGKKLL